MVPNALVVAVSLPAILLFCAALQNEIHGLITGRSGATITLQTRLQRKSKVILQEQRSNSFPAMFS